MCRWASTSSCFLYLYTTLAKERREENRRGEGREGGEGGEGGKVAYWFGVGVTGRE